jgi:tubulin polyglutamylase TTLL9
VLDLVYVSRIDTLQDFDFVWADKQWMSDHFDGLRLQDHQRVNHFRNHYELTRKDLLIKNLKRIKKQLEKEDRYAAIFQAFAPRLRCSHSTFQAG